MTDERQRMKDLIEELAGKQRSERMDDFVDALFGAMTVRHIHPPELKPCTCTNTNRVSVPIPLVDEEKP